LTAIAGLLNTILTGIFDLLCWPFLSLPPIWAMIVLSFLAGIFFVWLFGKTSNQKAIKKAKGKVWGNLIGIRLFQDDIGIVLKLQGRILRDTLIYMRYSLVPMLIMMIPVVFVLIQLNLRFSVRPLAVGKQTVVDVEVRDQAALNDLVLEAPEGIEVKTVGVRIPSENTVSWRIRAIEPGRHAIKIRSGELEVKKLVVVGRGWGKVPAVRSGRNAIDVLLWPGEPPIPGGPVRAVEIQYPPLDVSFAGFSMHWLIWFFILSIVFGYLMKDFLGVQL
jgi:uncharacterized membrane protein (DUF106 family)